MFFRVKISHFRKKILMYNYDVLHFFFLYIFRLISEEELHNTISLVYNIKVCDLLVCNILFDGRTNGWIWMELQFVLIFKFSFNANLQKKNICFVKF